jgi:hypothetical protein
MTGTMATVSALLPSNACAVSGKPATSVDSSNGDLRFQASLLGKPGSRNPSPASVTKYSVYADPSA